jgi:phosphate/sulfate permease
MENIYLLLVIVLFALAVSDLIVGVSVDALNFLSTSFALKSAPRWMIFALSGFGILLGLIFSGGMTEVARNGIFHPDQFLYPEIMTIFLAVMIADVLLLNIFKTFGLLVSTTVSIIFNLLGASVAVAVVKLKRSGSPIIDLTQFINADKVLAIISGILASVAIAFIVGFILQWLIRIIFTFQYQKRIRYFGSLYGGVIFLLLSDQLLNITNRVSWFPNDLSDLLQNNRSAFLFLSFIVGIILLQFLQLLWKKLDILKVIILIGTFTLAIAFGGNDLANFIGVPLAGFESFKASHIGGVPTSSEMSMDILNQPGNTAFLLFLAAGVILFLSMLNSRKSRILSFATDDYSIQNEGLERIGYFPVSRSIIKGSIVTASKVGKYINPRIRSWVNNRFDQHAGEEQTIDKPGFDNIRVANILLISSMLVYSGTCLKLPLSTAYITFMVAIGTSLADRKWDRESAVWRISGMISLIGSWFFNAATAFIVAALLALLILAGGNILAMILGIIVVLNLIRKKIFHRKREVVILESEEFPEPTVKAESVLIKTNQDTSNAIIMISKAYYLGLSSFHSENRDQLGEIEAEIEEFNQRMRKLKANIFRIIQKLQQDSIETGHYYVQIIDYLREMAHSIKYLIKPLYEHLGNNHKPFSEEQNEELIQFTTQFTDFLNFALHIIKESRFEQIEELIIKRKEILDTMRDQERKQIRRIKRKETNSRNSVLYFSLMSESKNLLLQTVNLLKATRDFVSYTKS